jgi:hypothetical protein
MSATSTHAEPLPLDLAGLMLGSAVVICPVDVRSGSTR